MVKINTTALSTPPEVSVEAFLNTSVAIGHLMRVCSALPGFSDRFTFLHSLIVFAVSKEPNGLPLTVLCRQIGLSSDEGQVIVRQLEMAGAVKVAGNGIQVTDEGLARLAEVNRQLLPYVQTALDNPDRLRGPVRLLHYIMRAWSKGRSRTHEDCDVAAPADDFEPEQPEAECPYGTRLQPPPPSFEAVPQVPQAIPMPGIGGRIRSMSRRLFRGGVRIWRRPRPE